MNNIKREKEQQYFLNKTDQYCKENPNLERFGVPFFYFARDYITENDVQDGLAIKSKFIAIARGLKENDLIKFSETESNRYYHKVFLTEKARDIMLGKTKYSKTVGVRKDGDKKYRIELYQKYDFHTKIKEVSFNQFQDGYFKDAILNAFIEVVDQVKIKASHPKIKKRDGRETELDGDDLMNRVFGCDSQEPIIKFNDLSSSLQKAEQRGLMYLYKGIVGIRNKKAHLNFLQKDPLKTIEYLSLASLLMRLLDSSDIKPQ